ncbi:MAG: 23S rRNA (uridine(2552)-2'-O)-methyltransferase [Candidatus Methanomethylicota archaeon]|uniref:Ribosomal RNA large subunit methyltransferase E n=1 Tax=Thermoproteota archaeon TaxID=2056631 RepID=A0A497EN05_9CREN|nr:MAG: 23S rRNA (uridine(2552)-2'-O)-methyltransferase [Candidatus Verstraetearchaeota archaeon]RLE52883.1 MAG: 23S rRNA (uridine(2552)-2'-O)-methyltransferase [Candidatus Verstraetearchaeota archaeon]
MGNKKILRDHYYLEAKARGYRARSAYKLKQILRRYKLIKKGDVVVDLGAAPGSWLQVAREYVGESGLVVGIDISPIKPLPYDNVKMIIGDVRENKVLTELVGMLKQGADVLLSDLAPKFTGIRHLDHVRQMELAEISLQYARRLLKDGGSVVIKALQGEELENLLSELRNNFEKVKVFKPPASRKTSAEVYLIGMKFKRA